MYLTSLDRQFPLAEGANVIGRAGEAEIHIDSAAVHGVTHGSWSAGTRRDWKTLAARTARS